MTHLPSTLYTIQTLELAIDKARARLEEIEAALAYNERVATCQDLLQAEKQSLQETRTRLSDLELEAASLSQKIDELDKVLYSGKIADPKELQERQIELEELRRRQQLLLENQSAAQAAHQAAAENVERLQLDLAEAIAERDQLDEGMTEEQHQLKALVNKKLKERKDIAKAIPADLLKQYRTLRKRKNGVAVALLDQSTCTACHIEQPRSHVQRVIQSGELSYCIGCGRILVGLHKE
ncbi:MAG: hypothetical protein GYB66_09105 [Chloroflexi bacterium]|nr:hypothetical protein [Chloroflexota bacterium]